MKTATRYAIYYAPAPDTRLWRFGSHVLGYDAATGLERSGFALGEHSDEDWASITAHPRVYGFHATLKAPFHLGDGDEIALKSALAAFCAQRATFRLGPLAITSIRSGDRAEGLGFVAMTPAKHSAELVQLEADIVTSFDRFRRALTDAERAKRRPDQLTQRQRNQLENLGYPFVLDDYRFHMTLTGPVTNAPEIADILADRLANDVGTVDVTIDALSLFRQDAPGERFIITDRFSFGL